MDRNFTQRIEAIVLTFTSILLFFTVNGQSVYDVIDNSPAHTSLKSAIDEAGLAGTLQDLNETFTVFAPDDDAFDDLAEAMDTDLNGILEMENLDQILLYHVLDMELESVAMENGDTVTPINDENTLKLTVTTQNSIYVNHAQVNTVDINADNGIVHSLDAVVLADETVVDIAIDNEFNTLVSAVVTAELLPTLTDPFGTYTVFAPTDEAFDDLADKLDTDIDGLLELENLADILKYHVLVDEVASGDITNGLIADPLNNENSLKFTLTAESDIYVNHAQIAMADINSENGTAHAINAVALPNETVVDVAINDDDFNTLVAAIVSAELLPVLTDPFATYTVFAPTDIAFQAYAESEGTDEEGILELEDLEDILLYHVLGEVVLSAELESGQTLTALNEGNLSVFIDQGETMINDATLMIPDLEASNGAVHVIDGVLIRPSSSTENVVVNEPSFNVYPNPATDLINIDGLDQGDYIISDQQGRTVKTGLITNNPIQVDHLNDGIYFITTTHNNKVSKARFIIK